jgi:small subunit ribosomal protein S6
LRDYEVLYIVRPDLEDDKVQDVVKRVNSLIKRSGGSSDQTSLWGKRKLAYEVKHQKEGSYVLQDFQIEPDRVPELESALKITEEVLRHLIVRKPEKAGATSTTTPTSAAPPPAEATPETAAAGPRQEGAADQPDGDREEEP